MNVIMNTAKRLAADVAVIILLSVCLLVTTLALSVATVTSENNVFGTGKVSINLNGGEPVITETEFLFEPGMTVEKPFYVMNTGTCEVWYRLYFSGVSGGLADVLDVYIIGKDGETLYSGKMSDLVFDEKALPAVPDTALGIGEKRELKIRFVYPAESTSDTAGEYLGFNIVADAVQVKNNEEKRFD